MPPRRHAGCSPAAPPPGGTRRTGCRPGDRRRRLAAPPGAGLNETEPCVAPHGGGRQAGPPADDLNGKVTLLHVSLLCAVIRGWQQYVRTGPSTLYTVTEASREAMRSSQAEGGRR